jgi:uncharacterized coiled-coil protein SlyX
MNFIKRHFTKIVICLLAFLFVNSCAKNCSKGNSLRTYEQRTDSLEMLVNKQFDSIRQLNGIINVNEVEIKNKNSQIEHMQNTINAIMKKTTTNNIRVIVPEQNKD